jgi:NDP-sugar pyrophosphorylase family protein
MIQPLAYIHPSAKIAENVTIDPFTTIYGDVEIGKGTWIGPHVTIMDGARIGENCKIILSGDDDQFDIADSGLKDAINRLERIEGIDTIKFSDADIVRSKMCREIIKAYKF